MVQRKLIVFLSVLLLLALTAGSSQGSLSRVEGMGLNVPLLSQFTDDYANIYWYPTSVVRQNNLVLAEVGANPSGEVNEVGTAEQSYTLVRNFPRFGAIAFQMAQEQRDVFSGLGNLNHEQLDVIWGRAFSSFDFAVRLDVTNSSYEYADNTPATYEARGFDTSFDPYPFGAVFFPEAIELTDVEINTWGITPAIALHFGSDDRLEAAATYRRYTLDRVEGPAPGEEWEDGGNASFSILTRAILHRGGTHTWYPAAWYVKDDLSWEVRGVTLTPRSADETYKRFGVGISDNMRVNNNNLLLWGVTVFQTKHEYERTDDNDAIASTDLRTAEDKTTMLPLVFAAIETEATSWLRIRLGASRGRVATRSESSDFDVPVATVTEKIRVADFDLSLGTGIHWNNLDIDMVLNEQFPLSGGYILSGNEETPFNRVSATYHF